MRQSNNMAANRSSNMKVVIRGGAGSQYTRKSQSLYFPTAGAAMADPAMAAAINSSTT